MDPVLSRLRVFLILTFAVLAMGSLGFVVTEGLSLPDAIYFSIVTVATVGYGDIHPASSSGKLLAIVLILTGVGTFLGVIANATEMMLNKRQQTLRVQKLNMVMGVFFSEIGTTLLQNFSRADPKLGWARKDFIVTGEWSERDFLAVRQRLKDYDYKVDTRRIDLEDLRTMLGRHKDLFLRLMENPVLLENESFAELVRATFHLNDELSHRNDLAHLPDSDLAHLGGDNKRVYKLLVHHWLDYVNHLKDHYPYLFSLAMRTNPFDDETTPIVK